MTIHKKFDSFIATYNTIPNEAVALKTLKDYMFSLPTDEMLEFMNYTQTSLFAYYKNSLKDKNCSNTQQASIEQQLKELDNLIQFKENTLKAA